MHTTQPKTFYVDLQSTSHCRTFRSEHIQLSKSVCKRSSAAIGTLQKYQTSIDGPIPFTSEAHFRSHDVLLQGQTKSNEGFLGPMEKGFPLVSEGDGAVVRALRTEYWKKLASVRVKLIWVGSAHELVAVSSTNVGSVFDKCRPSWNFVKEWRGVQGGVVYRQLAVHNTPLVYSRSSELLTCIAQDSSTWCVHVCNKRVFNVPVTRTTLHELVGHAPTSAAC